MNFWPHDQMCWLTILKLHAPVQFCSGACLYAEDKQFIIHIMLKDSEIIGYEPCPQKSILAITMSNLHQIQKVRSV